MKAQLKKQNFKDFEKIIHLAKVPYTITLSNYTQTIESEFLSFKEIEQKKDVRFFAGCSKVKKDCLKMPLPELEKEFLFYNDFNIDKEYFLDEIYGVDINNCYGTILHNEGYISAETYEYLNKLKKLDRLASIGSLASNKKIFSFNANGELINFEDKIKETENYFYHAVKRTFEIMKECKDVMNINDYLFTWVDCIYFREPDTMQNVIEVLEKYKLKYKIKKYTQFLVIQKNDFYKLSFFEDEKQKFFNVPLKDNTIKKQLQNYILSKTNLNRIKKHGTI
jgi:hypothetical protein